MALTEAAPVANPVATPLKQRVRGRILLLLCVLYALTYVDRVNISTAAPSIKAALGLSDTEFGFAISAFALPYAFLQLFGGWIGDRFGPRRTLLVVGIVCGVATIGTGFAGGLASLVAARLALGVGEGTAFPTATHAMAVWLPADRRGFGQGIVHSASRLGNAATPLLVAVLIGWWGWAGSFWLVGAVSIVWAVLWFGYFRDRPAAHRRVGGVELAELAAPTASAAPTAGVPWRALARHILPVTGVDFCYGWVLWVFLTWLPSFFSDKYGLPLTSFALYTSFVLGAGVLGDFAGGVLTDRLARRTGSPMFARRLNIVVGLTGSLLWLLPLLLTRSLTDVTVCLAGSFFFLELTNAALWAIPMDVAPRHAGAASGLMNSGFGIAGVISPIAFGYLLDHGGWELPFGLTIALLAGGVLLAARLRPEPLE
jgi:MFS family permease